ncbi:E3 ubiquitin-protein ligase RNF180 isoform X2 [Oryzias latipes]|uniref:E3 ubiquitin-protein ligase RNF180 isoform X2 n=1 Tax=Oryzias latipes TaxID=8090 RepID=UPI0002A48798|nr:E3 ubiquitin-protein ligase RNF180 isoform X2 [Oryzias latipes]
MGTLSLSTVWNAPGGLTWGGRARPERSNAHLFRPGKVPLQLKKSLNPRTHGRGLRDGQQGNHQVSQLKGSNMASLETDSASSASSVEGIDRNECWGENGNDRTSTPCLKTLRSRQKSTNQSEEGSSNNMEQLVRPPLPGRKAHRKTCSKDNQERWREGDPDREENKQGSALLGGRKGEKQRQRKFERAETQEERTWERHPRKSIQTLSGIKSDIQDTLEAGGSSTNSHRGHTCPEPQGLGPTAILPASLNPQFCQAAVQRKFTPLSSQRLSPTDMLSNTCTSSRNPDALWEEVRPGATSEQPIQGGQTHIPPLTLSKPEEEEEDLDEETVEDEEEEGSRLREVMPQASTAAWVKPCTFAGERRMSKREKNRMKSLRRRQRRREKWRQGQQQESKQSLTGNQSSSSSSSSEDEESLNMMKREGFICAVCLDVYFSPYICHPCSHIFCEPCLRTLAKNSPTNTPCPLCRTVITHVFFQKELNQAARTFFPKEYFTRKQNFQKASCAKWPLPSCRKIFRIFGGFQRQSSPIPRRQFPHGGGYRLNTMDFEDESRGWRFDMDMVIIYIYSVNWVIGFFVFCFLCYLFFPAF